MDELTTTDMNATAGLCDEYTFKSRGDVSDNGTSCVDPRLDYFLSVTNIVFATINIVMSIAIIIANVPIFVAYRRFSFVRTTTNTQMPAIRNKTV